MNGRLRIRSVPRGGVHPDAHPGEMLVALLSRAVAGGAHQAVGLVLRAGTLDLVDLSAARAAGLPMPWLLAGLTSTITASGPALAVGVLGVLGRREGEGERRVAVAFLEWEDNRWWWYEAPLGEGGRSVEDERAHVRSAEEGDALPGGLGRWWSAARRSGMRMQFAQQGGGSEVVN